MSDYGALISLVKKDGTPVTDAEKLLLTQRAEEIKKTGEFEDAIGESFQFKISPVVGEPATLLLLLSEYWHGDGDEQENFEFAEENDRALAQEIAGKLATGLDSVFDIKAEFEEW